MIAVVARLVGHVEGCAQGLVLVHETVTLDGESVALCPSLGENGDARLDTQWTRLGDQIEIGAVQTMTAYALDGQHRVGDDTHDI